MIVNQANLHGLAVGYSTAYNKSFEATQSNYQKIATTVPSTTGEQDYKWLGQMPRMKEWIGEREVQSLDGTWSLDGSKIIDAYQKTEVM